MARIPTKPVKKAVKKAAPVAKKAVKKAPAAPAKAKGKPDFTGLTGLELHRAQKAAGMLPKKKAGASTRKPLPTWPTPAEFKPAFFVVNVKTEKDGLLGQAIQVTRVQGRLETAPDRARRNLESYDQPTINGILSRLSAVTYATNPLRRLPANTQFKIILRVINKSRDGTIGVSFKDVQIGKKSAKTGRVSAVSLDKKDPIYRSFRKSARILPAAFKNVVMPPKLGRGKAQEEDDE